MFSELRHMGSTRLLMVAIGAFGLSTVLPQLVAALAILSGVGFMAMAVTRRHGEDDSQDEGTSRVILSLIAIFSILSLAGPVHDVYGTIPTWIFPVAGLTWLVLGASWLARGEDARARRITFTLILIATAAIGSVHIVNVAGLGLDVFFFHEEAADAIANGLSPYSDAVTVPNGAPEGDPFIVGYPYPPITALSYSVGAWLLGDSRWTSLAAWLIALALIGARSLRRDANDTPLGLMLATASIPGWPLVLTSAWSEPLSLALLAVAAAVWSKPASFGAIGLFFGSKQYLLAGTPLLVTNRVPARWTRVLWAALGLTISVVPVLIWGVPEFVDAAIRFHLEAPARRDGTSIVGVLAAFGIDWVPPTWLVAVSVISVAVLLWRRVADARGWLAALGVVLTVALFLSGQAFPNYWFLIAGIAALAAVTTTPSVDTEAAAGPASPNGARVEPSAS